MFLIFWYGAMICHTVQHFIWVFTVCQSTHLRVTRRPPDKSVLENYFSYFSTKTYVVGTQKKLSQWDGSFEHTKHMFKLMGKILNAV